ncbi:MAG TPA: carboxypeptidase regulatory-like domain-containing protein, partial [Chloroflexota bacterium]|nr:carboxypeptidase regulatory-like domain-containing protein [Chloroflexota bacterium]
MVRRFLNALASIAIVCATLLPASAEANTPPGIKASEVLVNAQSMLGVKYVFGGNDPKAGLDCSAYVSRAWVVSRHTTDTMQKVSRSITKDELLPGDALNHNLAGRAGHIRIFDKWATTDKALVWVYEATEPAVIHHVVPYDPRFVPIRRLNIDSDVPMPPPPPLPVGKTYTPPPAPVIADGALVGQVVDEQSGKPLSEARFFYWASQDQYRVQSLITDKEGRFAIPRLPAATYEIAAYASGHNVEMDGKVIVTGNRTTVVELRLAKATTGSNETRLQSGTSTILPVGAALTTAPTALPQDYPVTGGHFYTQATGGDGISGFAVTNDEGVLFWDEFRRLGGVGGLGYPVSRRFVWQGFTVQVMQKGVLQWRPETSQAWLTNV